MRLNELNPKPSLTGIQGLDDMAYLKQWQGSAIEFARSKGFTPIGSGGFANVFKSPKYPFVIKVFDSRDRGYQDWLKFCMSNQNNPYVPKVRGKIVRAGSTMCVIRLEPLTAFENDDTTALVVLRNLVSNFKEMWADDTWPKIINGFKCNEDFVEPLNELIGRYYIDDEYLRDVCEYINRLLKGGASLDMKKQNFLMRGRQLVFTDTRHILI